MQKTAYKDLASSRRDFEGVLFDLGLKLQCDVWLYHAYELIEKLTDVYKNIVLRDEFMKQQGQSEVYSALQDIASIKNILPQIATENKKTLKRKFAKILRMEPLHLESPDHSEARNILWELEFLSSLKRAGLKASLGEPNPDILALIGTRQYYIQCKRLYSPKETALRRNIILAVEQLERDLSRESKNTLGMLALSLERPFTGDELMLVTESAQTGTEKLRFMLDKVIQEYGRLWQDPLLIRNPKIVAVALHIMIPGIVREENLFVTGTQVTINNTWSDGQGFEFVVEDFSPLKEALEY